jgi:3-oxoacyl-[acyl-carrier-protein] synthase-1
MPDNQLNSLADNPFIGRQQIDMTPSSVPLLLSHFTLSTAAGCGNEANIRALQEGVTGLRPNDFLDLDLETMIGRVHNVEAEQLPHSLVAYQCRNNQLAQLALQQDDFISFVEQARSYYGAHRIGIFLGTSTSGILNTELAYSSPSFQQTGQFSNNLHFKEQHNCFSVANFVRHYLHITGPAQVISTACSSSAKAFASAARYIELGLCDAAIVGGVDSLCLTTLYGFNALELIAKEVCRPADHKRNGLSIGEAAAFVFLEKADKTKRILDSQQKSIYLRGYGESSDAWHMSSPHPEGRGALQAMNIALKHAALTPNAIDYVNLHGTATRVNDQMEDKALQHCFLEPIVCS